MYNLTVDETWSGTPMKMSKRYKWTLHINMMEYKGKITSESSYNSPEEAIEDYKKICGCDEFLGSIQLSEQHIFKDMSKEKDTMPEEMRKIINDFFGNKDRLKAEWDLCNTQYVEARETLNNRDATHLHRLDVKRVTDYWVRRKQALERVLDKETLENFKKS